MSLKANSVLKTAGELLVDEEYTRWTVSELAGYLNDGLLEIALQKPTATSENILIELVKGTYQVLPQKYQQFLKVVRNVLEEENGERKGGPIVNTVDRQTLDVQEPYWHDENHVPFKTYVKHFVFDETDPLTFYVYPGNDGTGKIEAVVSLIPEQINTVSNDIDDYNVDIELKKTYRNALVDYVMYRAHSKDAQIAGSAQRAALHYQQFANSIGMKLNNEMRLSPNVKSNGGVAR